MTNIEAVGQTEILEIRASTIKELLSRNSHLAPAFSQNLAEHQEHSLRGTLQPQPPIAADAILERINAFYGIGGRPRRPVYETDQEGLKAGRRTISNSLACPLTPSVLCFQPIHARHVLRFTHGAVQYTGG